MAEEGTKSGRPALEVSADGEDEGEDMFDNFLQREKEEHIKKKTIRVMPEYGNTNRLRYEEDQVENDLRFSRTVRVQEDRAAQI